MIAAVILALALAIAQLAPAIAPARGELVTAIVRGVACVDVNAAAHLAALCPLDDELAALDRQARRLKRAAAATSSRLWQGDLEHFEAFCRTLTLDNGRRMDLEPFQRRMLRDFFEGASETLIIIPKKNGKTTLMAALIVYHLCYVDNAECFLAASSMKQAGYCYKFASGFVNRSPALQRRILVRKGTRELRSRRDDGSAIILAADSDTADGAGPTLAIVDELHRAKSTALYDVFRDGLDARDGAMVAITTAGDDEDGPLGVMRSNFLAQRGVKRDGTYTYVKTPDGTNVMHEWSLTAKDNLRDLDLVKSVNPLRSMTKGKLKRRRDSTSMTATAWARFACNVWVQGDDVAIAAADWARKARAGVRLNDGLDADVCVGIDLGWTQDTSAFVPVGSNRDEPDEAIIDDRLRVIPAGTQADGSVIEGQMTDEDVLKDVARELGHWEYGIWPDCRFAIDPNAGGQSFAQWLIREVCNGDPSRVVIYSQQPAPMQLASMHFADGLGATAVEEGAVEEDGEEMPRTIPLYHPDNAALNAHVRAAVARHNGERWRFDKRRVPRSGSTRVKVKPIDGVIGGTLGYIGLTAPVELEPEPFVIRC